MAPLYLLCFFILINGQVNSAPGAEYGNAESALEKFEYWLKEKAALLINELTLSGYNMKSTLHSELTKGRLHIEKVADSAANDLQTWKELIGEECYKKAVQQLELSKRATIWEFLHCSNLTEAIQSVGDIIHETFNISRTILKYVENALAGLSDCVEDDIVKDIQCINEYIWKVINNIRESVPEVKTYEEDMKNLANKVSSDVNYCLYPPSEKIKTEVAKVMANTKQCVSKA